MSDASRIRKSAIFQAPTGRNETLLRYSVQSDLPAVSNGVDWNYLGLETASVRHSASPADEAFYVAARRCKVVAVSQVHVTAGSDAGSVTMQVTKDSGSSAPGNGVNLLTNTTDTGFDLRGAVNNPQFGALVTTAATNPTTTGKITLTVVNGVITGATVTTAGAGYGSFNPSLRIRSAGGTGAELTCSLSSGSIASPVVVNGGTGYASNASVEIVPNAPVYLAKGDRLSVDYAGILTSVAGVTTTVMLQYVD